MDSEKITAFVQEHWNILLIVVGAVLIVGAALNWNWLCPQGDLLLAGRGAGGRGCLEHGSGGALRQLHYYGTSFYQALRFAEENQVPILLDY